MAVLGRLKVAPNQRLDLPDIMAFDSYSAGDWKGFMKAMVGSKPYIVNGFEVFQPNTLIGNPAGTVDVTINESSLWWSEGGDGSFFVALPGASNKSVTLITNAVNYIEMSLTLSSQAEDARALWDPGANGGSGGEFTQVVDTESFLDVEVTRNNTGFSEDKIPLAKVIVNSSNNVVSITDCRPLLFRLGAGGNTPDPLNDYIWRDDPVGYSRTDTPTTMTSPLDPNVFRGADKNILSFKEWMDAVMSRLKELDGGSKWFQSSGGGGSGTGGALSLTNLFLDSQAGHSPIPDRKATLTWSKGADGKLRSENAVGYNQPVRWGANFGQLRWQLGGSFVSVTNRAYSAFTFELPVADGENVYLALQRDASLNGDPIVHFENVSGVTGFCSAYATGSFTGVACGDYIRKESNNVYQYYRVAELRVNAGTAFTNGTVEGTVADATVQYLLLETHDGPITTTDEPYRFFRKSYSVDDLVTSDIGSLDTSHYWIGRRSGTMFYLRDYGDMQPGEETEVLNDHDGLGHGGGVSDLILEKAYDAHYDSSLGFQLKSGATTTLLTIRRRLSDNTVGTPSNADNSGAVLSYTIAAPIGAMADNAGLWVRLGATSGGLASGTVTDVTTDNVWEVLAPDITPLRTYDNRNVFLVARKFTIGGIAYLVFSDGSTLSQDGEWINNHFSIEGDFFLKSFSQWSIPFISTADGKLGENSAEFFWDDAAGPDSLGELAVRNLRIGQASTYDQVDQDVARDLRFLPNLGAFTVQFGSSDSTIYIPGDLIVDGTTTSISTSILQVDDKLISVGVGNLLDAGNGSGLEVADDTLVAAQVDSTNGQIYVDITYGSAHGYALGDVIGADSNVAIGGVTAGQMSGSYTVVASGSIAGDAEVISATVLRVWTAGTATSTATVSLAPPTTSVRTYLAPWSIRVSAADGTYGTTSTSWAFRVKGVSTAPTITPVSGYGIVPTANSSSMQAQRIAFVGDDNAGPSGADTTLDFSSSLTWDGALNIGGNILPQADNTYDIGSSSLRWKTLHVGPGSVVVHGDTADTLKVQLQYSGSYGVLSTDSASLLQVTTGSNNGMRVDASGRFAFGATSTSSSTFMLLDSASSSVLTGVDQRGLVVHPSFSATSSVQALRVQPDIPGALTVTDLYSLYVAVPSSGGIPTIGSHYGIYIENLSSATTNVGIRSQISAGTGKWFLYGAGTATSYISGALGLGQSTQASLTSRLNIGTDSDTTAAGGVKWGTTGLSNLYRSAADTLKTDGNFVVAEALSAGTIAAGTTVLSGALQLNYASTKTANYAVLATDCVVPIDTSAAVANITVTLPASVAGNKGQVVFIKDVGGAVNLLNKAVIVAPNGTDTIDGANASITMTIPRFSLTLVANGAGGWTLH